MLHHHQGGKQLADLVGQLRVLLHELGERGTFAPAEAFGKLLRQVFDWVALGLRVGHRLGIR